MLVNYSLYRSQELISSASSTYVNYVREAAASGSERVYHYNAIPEGVKGIEPHLALCSFAGLKDAPSQLSHESSSAEVAPPSPEDTKYKVQSDGSLALPVTPNEGDAKPQSRTFPTVSDWNPDSVPPTGPPEWNSPPSNIPLGRAEDIIPWTDDDVDATDYKNMMDYDPYQDESTYDSTTDSSTEASAPPLKKRARGDSGYIQSYRPLSDQKTKSAASEVSGKAFPSSKFHHELLSMNPCLNSNPTNSPTTIRRSLSIFTGLHLTPALPALPPFGLLLLLVPGPLNPLPLPPSSSPKSPATPNKHANFLAHLTRYPYLTSHENYIRHTGYVLSSDDVDAPPQYLIVQEFSDLDLIRRGRKVGLDWKLKRQEAKHWWRKEERGAKGVRVGFFKLGQVETVDKTSPQ